MSDAGVTDPSVVEATTPYFSEKCVWSVIAMTVAFVLGCKCVYLLA